MLTTKLWHCLSHCTNVSQIQSRLRKKVNISRVLSGNDFTHFISKWPKYSLSPKHEIKWTGEHFSKTLDASFLMCINTFRSVVLIDEKQYADWLTTRVSTTRAVYLFPLWQTGYNQCEKVNYFQTSSTFFTVQCFFFSCFKWLIFIKYGSTIKLTVTFWKYISNFHKADIKILKNTHYYQIYV